jgi:hypothetical protein
MDQKTPLGRSGPLVLPIPGAKNDKQAIDNTGALSFSLMANEAELLSRAMLAWRV